MRVAIAGSGDLSRYFCEEFVKAGHEVVILTRSHKAHLEGPGLSQSVTDYTLQSLSTPLASADVLISTIAEVVPSAYIEVHRTLIQACQQSPRCKRFIPSEFAGNCQTYPDQPGFYYTTREPVRQLLREQTGVEWTLVAVGWLIDYLVPTANRHIKDIGRYCPVNLTARNIVIPGTGSEPIDFTSSRDIAKALAELVKAPAWEPYTYMSAEQTSWNEVARIVGEKYPDLGKPKHVSFYHIAETIKAATDEDTQLLADHYLYSVSHASSLPPDKVEAHRQKYFSTIRFRTIRDCLADFDPGSGKIL